VGLALSGAEGDAQDEQIVRGLLERHADLGVDAYDITGDALGTLHAAGGACVVLIAGTGSTARMLNTDGHVYNAGGHAHLVGDEGSATYLALSGVRCVFGAHDDMRPTTPHSVHTLRAAMFDFFNVHNIQGMYAHLYAGWDKAHFARFAVRIVEAAQKGDALSIQLLSDNGRALGRHLAAIVKHASNELLSGDDGMRVICVGSVWRSWSLMRTGFIDGCRPAYADDDRRLRKVTLYTQKQTTAVGYGYYVAHKTGVIDRMPDIGEQFLLLDTFEL